MHLFLLTRGQKQSVDKFIDSLLKVHLKTKVCVEGVNDGEPIERFLNIGVQPVQLWRITFPREYKDMMLTTLFGGNDGNFVPHMPFMYRVYRWLMMKLLKLQPVPKEYKTDIKMETVYTADVQKIGIGIKEDYIRENGTEGL